MHLITNEPSPVPIEIATVACVLQTITKKNDASRIHEDCKFSSNTVPDLSIPDYLDRLSKYFKCQPSMFVLVLMYIDEVPPANKCDYYC